MLGLSQISFKVQIPHHRPFQRDAVHQLNLQSGLFLDLVHEFPPTQGEGNVQFAAPYRLALQSQATESVRKLVGTS